MQHRRRYTVAVEERGDRWQARVYIEGEGGKSRRFSTGVLIGNDRRVSKREAEGVAKERAAKLADKLPIEAGLSDTSVAEVGTRMIAQKTADAKRPRAVEALSQNLDKHVQPYFGAARDVRTIKRRDLEEFKAHLRAHKFKPTTINNVLTAIRQVLKHACEIEELIEYVPVVKNVPVDKRGTGMPITPAQATKFLASFEEDETEEREFNLFLLNTGLRKFEALSIRWEWVDLKAREIHIPPEVRKGGKPQRAPTALNQAMVELLEQRQARASQPSKCRVWFQIDSYDDARRAAAVKAGIKGYRHHDARHTRATQLGANGASGIDLRDAMNWSTLAMVNKYTHPERARLHEMAESVQLGVTGSRDGLDGVSGEKLEDRGKAQEKKLDEKLRKIKVLK